MTRPIIVLKFGGTSVARRERWEVIAAQMRAQIESGARPVVVCSAISGVSNLLESLCAAAVSGDVSSELQRLRERHAELATELDVDLDSSVGPLLEDARRLAVGASMVGEVSPRTRARLLALGELMSTQLGAAFLRAQGISVSWMDARELLQSQEYPGQLPSSRYLAATCGFEPDGAIRAQFDSLDAAAVLTQGFIARSPDGDTVLLGRGGSDTSAAYLASILGAERLEIWTDVPGMFTANPRSVPSARLLRRLGYAEAQELATMGAKILHPRCIGPVQSAGIELWLRCTERPELEGTIISGDAPESSAQVKAISSRDDVELVSMETMGMWQRPGFLADAFACFKSLGISIDLVATSETNVTVSIDQGLGPLDASVRDDLIEALSAFCTARWIGPCSAVSLVGRKIRAILHELGPALEVFDEQEVYLVSQAASDLNLTFVVSRGQADRLVRSLHGQLFGTRSTDELFGPTWTELFEPETEAAPPVDTWWHRRADELLAIASEGTPTYVYDLDSVRARFQELEETGVFDRIWYAVKANPHVRILEKLDSLGVGFECVSPGELAHVRATLDPANDRILFTPNFAPAQEYEDAFASGVHVTIDNLSFLRDHAASFSGQSIFVRVDPGARRGHHKYVRTAGPQSKFGIEPSELGALARIVGEHDIEVVGLHAHVGSGIRVPETWAETAAFLASLRAELPSVRIVNVGGGFGVPERPGDARLDLERVAEPLRRFRESAPEVELWCEPGRYLVAEAGVLLARVTQTKRKGERHFIGIDAGMNSLLRPALYGAHHGIFALSRRGEKPTVTADVVGPICETGDVIGYARRLPALAEGDVVLVATAGAYGRSMSSAYNLRKPASEAVLELP